MSPEPDTVISDQRSLDDLGALDAERSRTRAQPR